MALKSPSGRLARWVLQLQPFNLCIEYPPGKANVIAESLSGPLGTPDTDEYTINLVTIDVPRGRYTQE